MVWLVWLVGPPGLVIATTGAVVSSVKLSDAVPVLPKLSVWLATMVWVPSDSPTGVNDQPPSALAVTVVAIGLPSIVKCTTVLARPVPLNASLELMRSVLERAGIDRKHLGQRRTAGAQRVDHRAAGAGIAGGVGDLRGQRVAATVKRDRADAAPAAVRPHDGAADRDRAVEW